MFNSKVLASKGLFTFCSSQVRATASLIRTESVPHCQHPAVKEKEDVN